jgi:putative transposase
MPHRPCHVAERKGGVLRKLSMNKNAYRGHRFPPAIIQLTVWTYARFTLSFRDVQELLAERGLDMSYETVRRWFLKLGQVYARNIRHRRTDHWCLDEMVIVMEGGGLSLAGRRQRGRGLSFPGPASPEYQSGRTIDALLKRQGFAPSTIVTDKFGSYGAAKKKLGLHAAHQQGLRQNNRCENAHLPGCQQASLQYALHGAIDSPPTIMPRSDTNANSSDMRSIPPAISAEWNAKVR